MKIFNFQIKDSQIIKEAKKDFLHFIYNPKKNFNLFDSIPSEVFCDEFHEYRHNLIVNSYKENSKADLIKKVYQVKIKFLGFNQPKIYENNCTDNIYYSIDFSISLSIKNNIKYYYITNYYYFAFDFDKNLKIYSLNLNLKTIKVLEIPTKNKIINYFNECFKYWRPNRRFDYYYYSWSMIQHSISIYKYDLKEILLNLNVELEQQQNLTNTQKEKRDKVKNDFKFVYEDFPKFKSDVIDYLEKNGYNNFNLFDFINSYFKLN